MNASVPSPLRLAEARLRAALPALEALLVLSIEQVVGHVRADGGVSIRSAREFVRSTGIRNLHVDEPGTCTVFVEVGDDLIPLRLRRARARGAA